MPLEPRAQRRRFLLMLVVLALLATACPPRSDGDRRPATKPCSRFGDTCQVAPGKLGTCVQRDDCSSGNCFVCQSQH